MAFFFVDFVVFSDMAANLLALANQHHDPHLSNINFFSYTFLVESRLDLQIFSLLFVLYVTVYSRLVPLCCGFGHPEGAHTKNSSVFASYGFSALRI
jgi:hypothetical protein